MFIGTRDMLNNCGDTENGKHNFCHCELVKVYCIRVLHFWNVCTAFVVSNNVNIERLKKDCISRIRVSDSSLIERYVRFTMIPLEDLSD